jgi:DNA-directed RNA polymerase II subunit RPB2
MSVEDFQTMAFGLCESLMQHTGLYQHHLASFEHLLVTLIPKIISEHSPVETYDATKGICHRVFFLNPRFSRPSREDMPGVFKSENAKDLHAPKLTLLSRVRVTVRHDTYAQDKSPDAELGRLVLKERKEYDNVTIFELPVMDGCELTNDYDDMDPVCRDRYSGTMVVNGYRKLIIIQTRLRTNFPFVKMLKRNARYSAVCETRSAHREKMRSSSTTKIYLTREKAGLVPKVLVDVPFIPKKIPITVLFRILGVETSYEMVGLICTSMEDYTSYSKARAVILGCQGRTDPNCDSLNASLQDLYVYVAENLRGATATGSSSTLGSRSRESHITSMQKLLVSEVLPHIGADISPGTLRRKAAFIGMSVARLMSLSNGSIKPDDVDSCVHKRFSTAGQTLAIKIRQLFRTHCKMLSASISRCCENSKHVDVLDLVKPDNITRPLRSCLAKGNFSVNQNDNSTQAGVCQVLNSMNRISRIAHLTTVNQPLSRDGSQTSARQLRPSNWGILCAGHTPDGRAIGLVTHHTMFADFRRGHDHGMIVDLITGLDGMFALDCPVQQASIIIVVNDEAVARTNDPIKICSLLRELRKNMVLPKEVSISHEVLLGKVLVQSDEGEAYRPILRVDGLNTFAEIFRQYGLHEPHHLYPTLLKRGCMEFVTKSEEQSLIIAHSFSQLLSEGESVQFTHIEIDPTIAMFGAVIGILPYSNHNQGPRNVYFGAMAPQAIGAKHTMFDEYQHDVQSHVLQYPQKQLARTITSTLVQGKEDLESITQLYMVAILPADGLGQEDAVVGNLHSFQRGLGHSTKYSTIRDVEGSHGSNDREFFCVPPEGPGLMGRKAGSLKALDKNTGLPRVGARIKPGEILIGKVLQCQIYKTGKSGEPTNRVIDRSTMWKGNGVAYVDSVRVITQGGARSVIIRMREGHEPEVGDKFSSLHSQKGILSAKWRSEDMPFTTDGMVPDILFSSHGLCSRMTIGMLREMVATQLATLEGRTFDATAFRPVPVGIQDEKVRSGIGMHTFYCGKTGEMIGRGFLCLASYMLQRHTVAGKVHARGKGPRNAITSQPVEGRSNNGGLKLGTMEVATIASCGSIATLNEAMVLHDGRECTVCECGRMIDGLAPFALKKCVCGGKSNVIFIPRITLVLYWELAASGIDMRLVPDLSTGEVKLLPNGKC